MTILLNKVEDITKCDRPLGLLRILAFGLSATDLGGGSNGEGDVEEEQY